MNIMLLHPLNNKGGHTLEVLEIAYVSEEE